MSTATSRTVSDSLEGFWQIGSTFDVPVNNNDALNYVLKSPSQKEQEMLQAAFLSGMKAVQKMQSVECYVEKYVLASKRLDFGRKTTSSFIPDDGIQHARKFGGSQNNSDTTKTSNKRKWFSCGCVTPKVNE
jgi:hypothetical protein